MTTTPTEPGNDGFPAALRLRLRNRREDVAPQADLWPGIASRISGDRLATTKPGPAGIRKPGIVRIGPLAVAASLALAVALGWQLRLPEATDARHGDDSPQPLLLRQATAMDLQYQAALREVQAARPGPADDASLGVLDRSAAEIRAALARDPHAHYLLDQLRNVYLRRLQLTLTLPRTS